MKKRREVKLPPTQKGLLVWDVLKGQATEAVKQKLANLNIEIALVPANSC